MIVIIVGICMQRLYRFEAGGGPRMPWTIDLGSSKSAAPTVTVIGIPNTVMEGESFTV